MLNNKKASPVKGRGSKLAVPPFFTEDLSSAISSCAITGAPGTTHRRRLGSGIQQSCCMPRTNRHLSEAKDLPTFLRHSY